jgi:hypothetical protein
MTATDPEQTSKNFHGANHRAMQDSLNSPIGYFSDGLVRGLVTFGVIPVVVAYLSFGLLGIVGAALALWVCYRGALRICLSWLGDPEATTGARPKHWLLGFGYAIVFQALILLFCFALADQEIVSERLDRILNPEKASDRASSTTVDLNDKLDAARADRLAGRYEEALEKYVWYYENALKHKPSRIGIRRTSAFFDWRRLADAYPPALEKLKEVRDIARESVKYGSGGYYAFSNFRAINHELDEEYKTLELFEWLDVNNPKAAEDVYIAAEDALVAAGEYALCGKYIEGILRYLRHEEIYRFSLRNFEDDSIGREMLSGAKTSFSYEIALLVALLVKNNRSAEASDIADRALRDWEGHLDEKQILHARNGVIPTRT